MEKGGDGSLKRPSWMLEGGEGSSSSSSGFSFASYGHGSDDGRGERRRPKQPGAVAEVKDSIGPSVREASSGDVGLNNNVAEIVKHRKVDNSWQIMKVKRVYEKALKEGLNIEEVARDRFGSLSEFKEFDLIFRNDPAYRTGDNRKLIQDYERYLKNGISSRREKESTPIANNLDKNEFKESAEDKNRFHADLIRQRLRIGQKPDVKAPSTERSAENQASLRTEKLDQVDYDLAAVMSKKKVSKFAHDAEDRRHSKQRQQKDHKKCKYCMEGGQGDGADGIELISMGYRAYLTIPDYEPVASPTFLIVPHEHHRNTLECSDEEWDEIRNYMKCIVRMSHDMGKGVVFVETSMNKDRNAHAYIECFAVPFVIYDVCPGFYKQEILSSGYEWSQNRKLVETSQKGFRRSLVKELPYFHAWFGMDRGFGTVIENEDSFPRHFGKDIVFGLLKKDYANGYKLQKLTAEELTLQRKRWQEKFSKYDWAADLHRS